jgi:hypothetical protein
MKVYQTDAEGYFLYETVADPDPLKAGEWLIPAGCTEFAPPKPPEDHLVRWTGASWELEVIPSVEPEDEPEPTPPEDLVRSERNQKLSETDWTQLADAPVNQAEWAKYRQALRDVTLQVGFPDAVVWPKKP